MAGPTPLISCIMPTRDRPHFVAQAVRYFRRQDHPALELVVVDDGLPGVTADGDSQIRHPARPAARRRPPSETWPAKPAAANSSRTGTTMTGTARGGSGRSWRHSLRSRRDVVGISSALHYAPKGGGSVCVCDYSRPAADPAWPREAFCTAGPPGSSTLSRTDTGESDRFVRAVPAGRVLAIDRFLYRRDPRRQRQAAEPALAPAQHRRRRRTSDRRLGLLHLRAPRCRRTPPPREARSDWVNLGATFMVADGYGSMAEIIALGMDRQALGSTYCRIALSRWVFAIRLLELVRQSRLDLAAPSSITTLWTPVFICSHGSRVRPIDHGERRAAGHLAAGAARRPFGRGAHTGGRDVFRAHSIARPIHVVPDGIDPAVYHYRPAPSTRASRRSWSASTRTASTCRRASPRGGAPSPVTRPPRLM